MANTNITLAKQQFIIWDFDGVIKDSVEVKSDAYEKLFEPFGVEIAKKVRSHHESNGGMSRFDKLPIYLNWAGQPISKASVDIYSNKFSNLVKNKVIESPWVPGVYDYILSHSQHQKFFIVTATPQSEIEEILNKLQIKQYFCKVIGAPTNKKDAIKTLLDEYLIAVDSAIMIGDSSSDYEAAAANEVPFVLRRTSLNSVLQARLSCLMIEGFA